MRRRRGDLGAVDRDDADLDQTTARAEREHRAEQLGDRRLVADAEARDRGVIWRLVGSDHAKRDVVMAAALDRARGPHPNRVGVDKQGHHHRRIVRRATPSVVAITRMKRPQVQLGHRIQDEPRQVLFGQPLPQARRQQQLLLAITRDEVLRHHRIVLNPPDATPVCATPSAQSGTPSTASRSAGVRREQ
jgi:hypothetical protein